MPTRRWSVQTWVLCEGIYGDLGGLKVMYSTWVSVQDAVGLMAVEVYRFNVSYQGGNGPRYESRIAFSVSKD